MAVAVGGPWWVVVADGSGDGDHDPIPSIVIAIHPLCDHHLYIAYLYDNLSILTFDSYQTSHYSHTIRLKMGWFWTDNPGRSSARVAPHPVPKDGATPPVRSPDTTSMFVHTDNMVA